ncbi:phage tail terminator-like protein [Phenylobacterium sp.]|uniref:phage tail terminator-like protein n=1 Tax=Phenylobacterium sp. TaxID=1871053 RepID=UPI00271B4036|nr:phage tail terminator-like protein [Phenylobacterium sp.]MDO8800049.1 phage tail terminator-like protein [Phenylobacterium sp.]
MSVVAIRAALETALAAISPALATAAENVAYTPTPGTPYQRAAVLFARPDNQELSAAHVAQGFMQTTLCYPTNAGPGAASTRAELIRTTFYRGRSLTPVSGVTVTVFTTPEIMPGYVDGDRYCIPVRVYFRAPVGA